LKTVDTYTLLTTRFSAIISCNLKCKHFILFF